MVGFEVQINLSAILVIISTIKYIHVIKFISINAFFFHLKLIVSCPEFGCVPGLFSILKKTFIKFEIYVSV